MGRVSELEVGRKITMGTLSRKKNTSPLPLRGYPNA
jgi:hypothetical protein